MNKASLNVHVWPYVSFALGKYLGLDLLAHCTSLYLTFWEAAKQLLKGMAPFWISTRTVRVTAVPHSFDTGCPQSLSFQVFWVSSSHFNLHFLMTSNIEYLFMFFLAICKSSFVFSLFLNCVSSYYWVVIYWHINNYRLDTSLFRYMNCQYFLPLYVLPTGEGNGNPLQYSCLENPMDGGAW